jgi:hypothetical protein
VASREGSIHGARQVAIDHDLVEIDKGHAELARQGEAHGIVRDVAELHQDLADRQLLGFLSGQRMIELLARDGAAANQQLAQLGRRFARNESAFGHDEESIGRSL